MKFVDLHTFNTSSMKKKTSLPAQFALRIFLIAVVVNTAVSSAQLLHNTDYSFSDWLQTVFLTLRMSLLVFAIVCLLLFLIILSAGMGREKTFWLLMICGLLFSSTGYILLHNIFIKYTDQTRAIAAVAAFAVMVSVASQYQFFHQFDYQPGNEPGSN